MILFLVLGLFICIISNNLVLSESLHENEGCGSYIEIDEIDRGIDYYHSTKRQCDNSKPRNWNSKWVRFRLNGKNSRIPFKIPNPFHCSTDASGYICDQNNIYKDMKENDERKFPLCFRYSKTKKYSRKCHISPYSTVKKCVGGFYVFKFYRHFHNCFRTCVEQDPDENDDDEEKTCFGLSEKDPSVCSSAGKCSNWDYCQCDENHEGKNCSIVKHKCFGVFYDNENVCSKNGQCFAEDQCSCNNHYFGSQCQYSGYNQLMKLENYNIAASRLVCGGDNRNGICSVEEQSSASISIKQNLGDLKNKTIRQICSNQYWTIASDSNYAVYIWGKIGGNKYLTKYHSQQTISNFTSQPTAIQFNGKAKKLACTKSSLLILTWNGTIYAMGKNENSEILLQGEVSDEFISIKQNIRNVVTTETNIYLVSEHVNRQDKRIIYLSGTNFTKNGNEKENFNGFIELNNFQFPSFETPRILVFDKGALFTFVGNTHFFLGKDHPTTLQDESIPRKIDFTNPDSQLANYHPIDLIGRMEDGCLVIVSENKVFVSGRNCPEYNLETPKIHPYEITNDMYNDYYLKLESNNREIIDLKCAKHACFILTSEKVFGFGTGLFGFTQFVNGTIVKKITELSDNLVYLIPSMGQQSFLSFTKPENGKIKRIDKFSVNKFPPSFVASKSYLKGKELTIMIQKEESFWQIDPIITIGSSSSDILNIHSPCSYQGNVENTVWQFENKMGIDYYTLKDSWNTHFNKCNWTQITDTEGEYLSYMNRIYFTEYFFLEYQQSQILERKEEYELDVRINFKKRIVVDSVIDVSKNPYQTKFLVTEQEFDRESSIVTLFIQVQNDNPYYINAIEIQDNPNDDADDWMKFQQVPVIFEETQKRTNDFRYNYQVFKVVYQLDPTICDPSTSLNILGTFQCLKTSNNADSCQNDVLEEGNVDFVVDVLSEFACSELEENIGLTGQLLVSNDWSFQEEDFTTDDVNEATTEQFLFYVDKYAYFATDVFVTDTKIQIDSCEIEEIIMDEKYILYHNQQITQKGKELSLVLDDFQEWEKNRKGFHLQLKQSFLKLQYGNQETHKIAVKVKVNYNGEEGNNGRRSASSILTSMKPITSIATVIVVAKKFNFFEDLLSDIDFGSFITYLYFAIFALFIFLVIFLVFGSLCLLVSSCFSCGYCIGQQRKLKKQKKTNALRLDDFKEKKNERIVVSEDFDSSSSSYSYI